MITAQEAVAIRNALLFSSLRAIQLTSGRKRAALARMMPRIRLASASGMPIQ